MDIKGDWKKRAVSGLMVLAMALSLLPTSILAADTRSVTDNAIKNGSFEQPAFDNKNSPQWDADLVHDWHTTASDQKIEFGSRRNGKDAPQLTGNDKTIPDGDQFAELNADEESTLYQYATTVGGNVYEWGLSHRGREGVDRMALIIGPKQDIDPAKPSKDGRDQFMRMTDWVRQHASDMGVTVSDMGCTQKITVYSKKFAANGGFQNDIGDSAFSASPSDVYTEKWNVWIIGTNNNAWGNYGTNSSDYAAGELAYSCRYAVPDGQKETVFAFCSYSAATYNKTLGNLIDNIHFSLYQTITATGRLSSTEPNLQNIPMRIELGRLIRKAFLPKSGFVFVDADYSQIELRVLAHLSGDEKLIEAYRNAQDIHRTTASQVFHIPFDEVTDLQRRNAKAVNFGIVYGISSFGLSQDLSITKKEAAEYIERYFETYPKIKGYLDGLVAEAKEKGYVTTMFGRRRPIPELSSSNFMQRSFGERVAMNSPIQGTAADIIKIAMIRVDQRLRREGLRSRIVLQVHDELLIETWKEELEQVQSILATEMKRAAQLQVELEIDMKMGNSWFETK